MAQHFTTLIRQTLPLVLFYYYCLVVITEKTWKLRYVCVFTDNDDKKDLTSFVTERTTAKDFPCLVVMILLS